VAIIKEMSENLTICDGSFEEKKYYWCVYEIFQVM